ncbi:hypothetical protein Exig_0325 [Exiguobacterium sibiricum 255-15]|uniref:Uncharacterized protein n=1 Tax=Exiguobacterium sibiricum (strain DSM 17290 / CCUG 55495 / CIP 109462 / JCM 13490 / 255-15) TaxID=262543 RepID=B1YIC7_EXIS2|nr:hypothetical protein [Exiguobacterium sibiricum]ACB59810.1 hypothetical protein Exig_0325 [Exiguobacterium sibiricum 255-15]
MVRSTKQYVALFVVLLIAIISINAWPASLYPDGSIGLLQIAASFVWLIFLTASVVLIREEKTLLFVFYYLSFGFVAGTVVYLITFFERYWLGDFWFDIVSAIQYPFYYLFAVPLFGFNAWFDVLYGQFALFAGFAYIVLAIGVSVQSKKIEAKRLRY